MALFLNYNKSYFVTATNTDIGKTFFIENICRLFLKKRIAVKAIKPIASGFSYDDNNSDSAKILNSLGCEVSKENIDSITPWHFKEAVSPHFAAIKENKEIDFLELIDFCKKNIALAAKNNQTLFIEGAGGVMTPINNKKTFLDLAFELKIPVLLLSANYLGSISQTLCAAEILKKNQIFVEKIIINDDLPTFKKNLASSTSQVVKTIENFSGIKTITLNNLLNS